MLKPPLSLLPYDLLEHIMECVASGSGASTLEDLCNLSLADRAFTDLCQNHIFRKLKIGDISDSKDELRDELAKIRKMLSKTPSIYGRVRIFQLSILEKRNRWLFKSKTLTEILLKLGTSQVPPHTLRLRASYGFQDPVLAVYRLRQTFFSRTLTTLHLWDSANVVLDVVTALNDYEDFSLCTEYTPAALETFRYRTLSHSIVKEMVKPPPIFPTPVVVWSSLRVLEVSPFEKDEMSYLQRIMDAACDTLEELHLKHVRTVLRDTKQLPLASLVELSRTTRLRTIALDVIMRCALPNPKILEDINTVLSTIPASNAVKYLSFKFTIFDQHPFAECVEQDWSGFCREVIRIAGGERLQLDMNMNIFHRRADRTNSHGGEALYQRMAENLASLRSSPTICLRIDNPTFLEAGLDGASEPPECAAM
ncbi:hypothetical protein CVT26_007381 [Gymnopilus dilepis]|uniref:F-box domain-containing protein n=1 Tax=Gymnopilus dilepis TaxID=231916 RepID=A0A409X0Z9_9AGAR|nr:hypothetical protein CVT26_007381 [Gymnopilus dilepis]